MKMVMKNLADLLPYENNPRINDNAIEDVMQSIEQCGYITPIVVNGDNVILAGHTRYIALQRLGYEDVNCLVVDGLTEDQERKFRLLDNKIGEISEWDIDKLKLELDGLDFGEFKGFDELAKEKDDLMKPIEDKFEIEIVCPKCGEVVGTELCS